MGPVATRYPIGVSSLFLAARTHWDTQTVPPFVAAKADESDAE